MHVETVDSTIVPGSLVDFTFRHWTYHERMSGGLGHFEEGGITLIVASDVAGAVYAISRKGISWRSIGLTHGIIK